jgi:hypothetical protein
MRSAIVVIGLALAVAACDDEVERPFSPPRVQATPFVPAPPPAVPTRPNAPTPEANGAPTLRFAINPDQPSGPAGLVVTANMCGSTDPEGERLVYQYKWGGGAEHFSYFCRFSHTYDTPGTFRAFFCVYDEHDNRECFNQRIDITP